MSEVELISADFNSVAFVEGPTQSKTTLSDRFCPKVKRGFSSLVVTV